MQNKILNDRFCIIPYEFITWFKMCAIKRKKYEKVINILTLVITILP